MEKTEKITFRLTEQQKNDITRLASLKGVSSGQLIRNWIEIFLNNQISNSGSHIYQLEDGRQFPNMKALCNKLQISSHTARKRIKNGLIEKITIDPDHANKYGDEEIQTTSSRETNRIQI